MARFQGANCSRCNRTTFKAQEYPQIEFKWLGNRDIDLCPNCAAEFWQWLGCDVPSSISQLVRTDAP